MIFNIYPATVALALFLTQVAALPQPSGGPYPPPSQSSTPTPPSSTLSPYSSSTHPPYNTTSSYCPPSKETYPPGKPGHYGDDHGDHDGDYDYDDGDDDGDDDHHDYYELSVTYDYTFDNYSGSLNSVACSNGPNGLAAQYPTFGDLPTFPYIGGAFDVSWGSPNCGSCWELTNPDTGVTIIITAIDTAAPGFNIAEEAFAVLTNNQIAQGVVDVVAHEVPDYYCGF